MLLHLHGHSSPPKERPSTSASETVASYLNKRLAEIGVGHVFAIPGDYIAEYVATLDEPDQNAGLKRIHPSNEITAVYSADGYARSCKGRVGCVAFTYGVGALNAVQAVGGAYVERVPMVIINGSPSVAQFNSERDQGVLYHHMLDGSHSDYRILGEVTEIAVQINNPANAPEQIDTALRTCITASRPVYIEISNGISEMACRSVPDAPLKAAPIPTPAGSLEDACAAVLTHMRRSKRLVFMAGSEISRAGAEEDFAKLCRLADAPYVTSGLGKSVLAENRSDVRFGGTYIGKSSQKNVQDLVSSADCFVAIGVQDTDFNYLGIVTPDYNPNAPDAFPGPTHIQARSGAVLVGRGLAYWGNIEMPDLIAALITKLEGTGLPNAPFPGLEGTPWDIPPTSAFPSENGPTWDSFKSHLVHDFLNHCDADDYPTIVADSGFSFVALTNVKSAERGYVAQLAWAAIGYGTGASAGVALAQSTTENPRRVVTVAGDAAFAETVNAIGLVAQLGQNNVIFVMDNRVYAVEQWLLNANAFCPGPNAPPFVPLTDIPQGHIWDYVKIAEGFGGVGHLVTTNAELQDVLRRLDKPPINPTTSQPTFTLVAVRIPAKDLPDTTRWKLNCDA
ncbi:thiamine pyrophosphate-binding protein [Pelagimonas varians]|uniref:pyruvate decarboxylase n=1 Tax=Pelagimonas varians TaxID=696760 RepID=A0A238JQF1_9RHOB|nr:thiamine pyrophosphate-binding protein [Pelagimonas varians]PYG34793.1 indolepyruvate decarboxylase [Pelagimonas varians]SMX32397.1 Indole-3-pyruvate decarboxylase [Pelagimonas varians]